MSLSAMILSDVNAIFAADFTTAVTHTYGVTSETLRAIFDAPFSEMFAGNQVESSLPAIFLKTSDISHVTRSSTFLINSVTYYVNSIENDRDGITRIHLSRDAR